jgi:uncharacterized membrane protein
MSAEPTPTPSAPATVGGGLKDPKKSPKRPKKNAKNSPAGRKNSRPEPAARREPLRREPLRETVKRRPTRRRAGLDTPLDSRRALRGPVVDSETFGRWSEAFARFMGTAWFLVGMTIFVGGWLAWNAFAPTGLQFDPRRLNFTLMTLILSLQASYAAPLILLAQNRQADRDRVTAEQDRDRAERALADTEYLAREVAALRIALGEVATRDFVRSELRALLDEASITRKPPRKSADKRPADKAPVDKGVDSFGSTHEVEVPTDTG